MSLIQLHLTQLFKGKPIVLPCDYVISHLGRSS